MRICTSKCTRMKASLEIFQSSRDLEPIHGL
jgi:hypothetical protein